MTEFNDLCTPAKIYLIVSIVCIVGWMWGASDKRSRYRDEEVKHSPFTILGLICKLVLMVLWTLLLNWLCDNKYTNIAWIILLLPIILPLFVVFTAIGIAGTKNITN